MRRTALILFALSIFAMTSCDNKTRSSSNPLLTEWDTPFGMPPFNQIKPAHFKPAFIEAMQVHYDEIDQIVDNPEAPTFENVIVALDQSGSMLDMVSRIFSLMVNAESSDHMREVQREMSPILSAHWDNISMNDRLFKKVQTLYDSRMRLGLDPVQMRLLEKSYRNFVRSGAELTEEDKDRLKQINSQLAEAQIVFGNNVLAADQNFVMMVDTADVASLPRNVTATAADKAAELGEKGRYAFTLHTASLVPFLTYSDRSDLREQLYQGYINRCNYGDSTDNRPVINDIIRLRTEKARLLGYDNFAQYVLEDRMAENTDAVYGLLDQLWEPSLEAARNELEQMREMKLDETGDREFLASDWWYYAEKIRRQKYDLDEETLRPYFTVDNVQAGIFDLSNRLYGVTFRPVNIPTYHRDCRTFEVLDIDNKHLGILLMDLFQRDTKNRGAWCSSYRGRNYADGEKITDPIVTIVCNFTRPVGNRAAQLTLDETETFFHEFGHALHALFTDVPYRGLQGTERDFVELPSQIMENFAFEPALLRRYAIHATSNNPIPENLIRKIRNSAHFNQGFLMTEHLAAAFIDMDIHTVTDGSSAELNPFEAEKLYVMRDMIDEIAPRYRFPYFKHIFNGGYSAGYYSYKWAEVLDKDAFEAFIESGDVFNRTVAEAFRREILSRGGSADGMTLYRNFRGKDPSTDYLLYARGLKERPAKTEATPGQPDDQETEDVEPVDGAIVDAIDQ